MPPQINLDYDSIVPQNLDRPLFNDILVKFTYLVGMITGKKFYDVCFPLFLTYGFRYGLRPKAEVFQCRTFGYGRR